MASQAAALKVNRPARQPIRIRWWIFAFMFAFAMLSYIQRNSVAVAAVTVMSDLHVTQWQIGLLNAAFTTAYALAQLPGGVIGQRFGAHLTYVAVGIVGLVATFATPLAPAVLTGTALFLALLLAQAVLGISQGPVFPMFAAVLEKWFPANRWAIANGLQTAGMLLGGAVTPILIVLLTQSFGWKGALLWIAPPVAIVTLGWAWYGRNSPREHGAVTVAELAELGEGTHEAAPPVTWRRLLAVVGDRNVLLLAFSYLCMNYAFYLLSYWSFLYLVQVRHFSGLESGFVGMAPWIGAATGVLNTGGNVGGIICQPVVAALSGMGLWNGAFASGSFFALVAAGTWLFINSDRPAQT